LRLRGLLEDDELAKAAAYCGHHPKPWSERCGICQEALDRIDRYRAALLAKVGGRE